MYKYLDIWYFLCTFALSNNKNDRTMVKIAMYKKDNGQLLVIWRTPKENLVGELYFNGEYKRGKWTSRATFEVEDGDATEDRVKEYFGFSTSNSIKYWTRWA